MSSQVLLAAVHIPIFMQSPPLGSSEMVYVSGVGIGGGGCVVPDASADGTLVPTMLLLASA